MYSAGAYAGCLCGALPFAFDIKRQCRFGAPLPVLAFGSLTSRLRSAFNIIKRNDAANFLALAVIPSAPSATTYLLLLVWLVACYISLPSTYYLFVLPSRLLPPLSCHLSHHDYSTCSCIRLWRGAWCGCYLPCSTLADMHCRTFMAGACLGGFRGLLSLLYGLLTPLLGALLYFVLWWRWRVRTYARCVRVLARYSSDVGCGCVGTPFSLPTSLSLCIILLLLILYQAWRKGVGE